jgi:hypothetical protein
VLAPTSAAAPRLLKLDAVTNSDSALKGKIKVDDVIAQADFGIDIEI